MEEHREHNELVDYFRFTVQRALTDRLGCQDCDETALYVANLLAKFVHRDDLYAIRDAAGRRVESIGEMLAEGDVRMNASSFERERQVHKHLGDFLLFWSGLFPESLDRIPGLAVANPVVEAVTLGRFSYQVVSSFDYKPYDSEAPTYRRLSDEFETLRLGLNLLRKDFEGFAA